MLEKLLTPKQVAEWLGVSPAWVLDHASGRCRPYLPSVKLGKAVRFRREDVEQFIQDCLRLEHRLREAGRRARAPW
jgi:excisionase family DNA binding protein